jgi:hypothetical protein
MAWMAAAGVHVGGIAYIGKFDGCPSAEAGEGNVGVGSAALSLRFPMLEEEVFADHVVVLLRPFPERFPTGAINSRETAQLPELLRELRDFR